jgi:hypothetical protein
MRINMRVTNVQHPLISRTSNNEDAPGASL